MVNEASRIAVGPVDRPATMKADGRSARVREVAMMFGLGLDRDESVAVLPAVTLPVEAGRLMFVTGPSGGGKSTLLREVAGAVAGRTGWGVLDFAAIDRRPVPEGEVVIDAVDAGRLPLERALALLSLAGLNDAFVMLRRPAELSDGQRYRFALARAMAEVEADAARRCWLVVADEFGAALDRTTAVVIARSLRKWVTRSDRACLVVATTHDDLLEALSPDVLVEKRLGAGVEVVEASGSPSECGPWADAATPGGGR